MDSVQKEAKRLEIEYQVVAEEENRKNGEFLANLAKWLDLKSVDRSFQETLIGFISHRFSELNKARTQIKQLMEERREAAGN